MNELDKQSHYVHVVYISVCLVCWLTKTTTTVYLSTVEAEFVTAEGIDKDVLLVHNLLVEIGFLQHDPSVLSEDNQTCVSIVSNHVVTGRNRHV